MSGLMLTPPTNYNWNIFRYVADYLHLGGMALGLGAVLLTRSVNGFSRKTQLLFLAVYLSRYLDIFTTTQVSYLFWFKITFIGITSAMLLAFYKLQDSSYDMGADSANLIALVLPVCVATYFTSAGQGYEQELWTFSEFLEPLALVPQYIVCYRAKNVRFITVLYVLMVGGYRLFYVLNWLYKRYEYSSSYRDYTSWLGGILECILFIDFCTRIFQRKDMIAASPLGRMMLAVDSGVGGLSEKVEMNALGRRLPYGLSGSSAPSAEDKRDWNVSDTLTGSEESGGLLTLNGDDESGF